MSQRRLIILATLVIAATPALAHTGHGDVASFRDGFTHPFGGLDHLLAMVSVGLWAGLVGGRAAWAWPLAFLGFMLLGGALGLAHLTLPAVETAIALSVVVLGAAIGLGLRAPVTAGAVLCAFFALFHGFAHGAEMGAGASALAYAAGFLAATAILLTLGVAAARAIAAFAPRVTSRVLGAIVAVLGVWLVAA